VTGTENNSVNIEPLKSAINLQYSGSSVFLTIIICHSTTRVGSWLSGLSYVHTSSYST